MTYSSKRPGQDSSKELIKFAQTKKHKMDRGMLALIIVAGLMTASTIVLAVLLGVGVGDSTDDASTREETCDSKECVTAASRILAPIDTSVDPCDDFYEYACGLWDDTHLIPEDKSVVSSFNDVRDHVSETLKRVLEEPWDEDRDSIKKSKYLYAACMDTDGVDALGGQPALDLIKDLGGMPLLGDDFDSAAFSLEETYATSISRYGSFSVLSMWVGTDDKNSSANIIQMDQPSLGMPNRDYYLDESKRNQTLPSYQLYMHDYLSMLWKEKDSSSYDSDTVIALVEEITNLETDIAGIMAADEDRRDSFAIYNKLTIKDLQTDVNPDFDFLTYINTAMSFVNVQVTEDELVVIYARDYLANFTKVLDKYDNELLQNYMVWMILRLRISYLGKEYRDTQAPYRQAVSGTTEEESRWETCSDIANNNFPMPVGALFVEAAFPEENKAITEEMVENIRQAFKASLPENEWMDEETKQRADSKADAIQPIIAYPDYIMEEDNPKMDDDYADAVVTTDAYFDNMQSMTEFAMKENMHKYGELVDREEWITGPAVVNAFYSPTRNQIVFPAGILQPPFYDPGQPTSMNYGGIGMVIGHEITHGFDDSGSQFDETGNLNDWWTEESRDNFNEKAKCMEDQYSQYYWETAEGYVNGKLTLGENIADNGGIRETFDAYKNWTQYNPPDFKLPGLQDYTQQQLLFISFAQVWCGVYRREYAQRLILTDPHAPAVFRVIGSVSNYDEFGKAFECTRGQDAMYPNEEDTCRVW